MNNNSQSRKWHLTLNNPIEYGFSHEVIMQKAKLCMPNYIALSDEIATTGTYHTHLFILSGTPVRFSTLKNRFPIAHIEKAYGTAQENRDYIKKEGKWANDEKSETKVNGSFEEWGVLPNEKEEKTPKLYALIEDINLGKRTAEIIEDKPNYALKTREVEALRQMLVTEKKGSEFRLLEVVYLYGSSGVGKTRSIYEKFPIRDICRITSYRNNRILFDAYNGEDVLVFEEFHSYNVPISDMLSYLDIYPLRLPARYNDKVALFTKVYITSNIPLECQYVDIQRKAPEVWKAFLRRITKIVKFNADGTKEEKILNSRKEINSK